MARSDFNDDSYSPETIYGQQVGDKHGHSVNLRLKVPVDWVAQLDRFVEGKGWPEIDNRTAFIRDALYHRLRFWVVGSIERRMSDPVVQEMVAQEAMHSRPHAEAARRERRVEFFDMMRDTLQAAIVTDKSLVAQLVEDFAPEAEKFMEPYRGRLIDELESWRKRAEAW